MANYVAKLKSFEESTTLREFRSAIKEALLPHSSETTCKVVVKLNERWNDMTIKNLKLLLKHYFQRSDLFNHIHIDKGSVCITFLVPVSQVRYLISAVANRTKSLQRIGVFELIINGKVLLDEYDTTNFEESLIEAAKSGNTFEVSMLLQLGTDPNCQNANGETPLMLASEEGNEVVQELLLSAGADDRHVTRHTDVTLAHEFVKPFTEGTITCIMLLCML